MPKIARLTPARRVLLDRLLDRCLDLDEPDLRTEMAALAKRCPRLHARLSRLVAASTSPTCFLDDMQAQMRSLSGQVLDEQVAELPPGTRLGPWRIIETAGSGGMGTVYRGERADGAFDMPVAIKLIRISSKALDERLKLERRLLARLRHAHIARLLDGGATDDGMAFLVMEWVTGADLGDYCLAEDHPLSRKLDLFNQICAAVAHAHQRLVVHGDLKPANIRVGEDGQIRLLDFGVARLLAEEGADEESEHPKALTPAYSAPEQLAGEPPSTRSDVWALGAILCWLLTGKAFDDRHTESDLGTLSRQLPRGADLAAIIRRACASDPDARYPGPLELAADLARYRARQPISARAGSRRYRLARFIDRRRYAVTAAMLVAAVLVASGIAIVHQSRVAVIERDLARVQAERAIRISDFLVELFESADPGTSRGADITAREIMDQGLRQIDALDDDPAVQAGLLAVLARVHLGLGLPGQALALSERALTLHSHASHESDTRTALLLAARAEIDMKEFAAAENRLMKALQALPEQPTDLDDTLYAADLLFELARGLDSQGGRLNEVWPLLDRARTLTENVEEAALRRAEQQQLAGRAHFHGGDYGSALELFRQAHAARLDLLGEDHPRTLDSAGTVGQALAALGRFDEALEWASQVVENRRRVLGETHPHTIYHVHAVGSVYWQMGDVASAEHWWRQALALYEQAPGANPAEVATTQNALALALIQSGEFEQAEALFRQALARLESIYGQSNLRVPMVLANMAIIHSRRQEWDQAIELHLEALAMRRAIVGDVHDHVGHSLINLAGIHLNNNQPDLAADWLDQAEAVFREVFPDPSHPQRQSLDQLRERISAALE
ncbi:MAG: hypothetical protein EA370_13055 [Wenzhouxiangella sp.]|nr:MAG: hypothetical protein EA370_13055 [Wenzhouxiangella sp.]